MRTVTGSGEAPDLVDRPGFLPRFRPRPTAPDSAPDSVVGPGFYGLLIDHAVVFPPSNPSVNTHVLEK